MGGGRGPAYCQRAGAKKNPQKSLQNNFFSFLNNFGEKNFFRQNFSNFPFGPPSTQKLKKMRKKKYFPQSCSK